MLNCMCVRTVPNYGTLRVKLFRRGYAAHKENNNLRREGCTYSKQRTQRAQETKQMYFASKCCGRNPGTCQVEVVNSDKTVIDLEFIHPRLLTFDILPSLILLVPTYLFQ